MQMHRFDIVDIFLVGIPGATHKADQVASLHNIAFL